MSSPKSAKSFTDYMIAWDQFLSQVGSNDWYDEGNESVNIQEIKPTDDKQEFVVVAAKNSKKKNKIKYELGTIVNWNNIKKYGFIKSNKYDKNIFFHQSKCIGIPKAGKTVKFIIEKTVKGLSAVEVRV